jgi:glucose-6-phosphate 1-epimerase
MFTRAKISTSLHFSEKRNNTEMTDLKKFEIPSHLVIAEGKGGLSKVCIKTQWSTAELYLHGAHVTHFQKKDEAPLLFMSGASEYLADQPIRGGVPIIFPWFGPRDGFSAHGFARTTSWEIAETSVTPSGIVRVSLRLPEVAPYEIGFTITVGKSLSMELVVKNISDQAVTFSTCLHTYFHISSIDAIEINGLCHTSYFDNVSQTSSLETSPSIKIASEVDRVYVDTAAAVEILDSGLSRKIRIEKSGSDSTVIWNPWIDKSIRMKDFGDDEYLKMVCVESGNVRQNQLTLQSGQSTVLTVELHSEMI